ncbi:hypothetical protein MATR_12760 [Marivirga tractuosa]|uniref:Secreted protein n=1 Tax=Marivirga tractuosa (strain ATCC 23168 / DSM 4126 / NBRC 15989 / NCIMB 1408 / VKM B-1430 / H-43) TaxID=643867 RepID=E4TUY9_MARTH|nr:hypothetical protein [Marivirga tractuosa]ADR21094.1 hypothetical protein Ftrac_1099 [Marivirga tractuosa DSM 4126]BDD14451.1 hypothetical protein MATR_12760 [Marivirga tractuosa]
MKKNYLKFAVGLIVFFLSQTNVTAQDKALQNNYIGLLPAILVEPYDTVDAVEVNFIPIVYEFRIKERNDLGFQVRPLLNYRFLEDRSGFSQVGGTLVMNKYFLNLFDDEFWLKPQLGVYYTYAYNLLDKIQSMTLGIEPGVFMEINDDFSMSLNLQPGINYYPDQFSQDFVKTESGFKGHFGIIFHIGYNF